MSGVKNYLLYLVCVCALFLFLFLSVKLFEEKTNIPSMKVFAQVKDYQNKNIKDKEKNIDINYPQYGYSVLDKEVLDFVLDYSRSKDISINYTVYVNRDIITMFFIINNNGLISYKNINYSILKSSFISNNELIDFNTFGSEIIEMVKSKYSTYIYEQILNDNFKSSYISVKDNGFSVYFEPSLFENIDYKVYVFYASDESVTVSDLVYDKVIAFTFDDGPSIYTKNVVDALVLNNSKATFFELGNRMKYNQDEVRYVYESGMEVGSHTYAHKNLNKLSDSEIDEEINSTNIIFNEITGDNIKLLRPPYGNSNEKVKSRVNTPIITWNVDTNDWLTRDSEAIYNHILDNVSDGDIVLMHDIYPETLEAIKKVIPVLRERGYKITTVSELAKEKGVILENGKVYRNIL